MIGQCSAAGAPGPDARHLIACGESFINTRMTHFVGAILEALSALLAGAASRDPGKNMGDITERFNK
jgi:hypothetical protein